MSQDVLERMISTFMATDQPQHSIGWQGGEPTLMGVDFFKEVTRLQQRCGRPGASVSNGLQTNAVAITDEFAEHLAQFHFLVGVSIDGPQEIHDLSRKTIDGRGSHQLVMQSIERLKKHRVEFNVLTLVNAANVVRPREIYKYMCDSGFLFQQYIECGEFDGAGGVMPYAISGEQWGDFLCELYDAWRENGDERRVSVRLFDSLMVKLVEGGDNVCQMGTNCCQYLVVEHNGDIYPCDFFVEPELKLGNIMEDSWDELLSSERYLQFGEKKSEWNAQCRDCEFLNFCAGDCQKNRFRESRDPRQLSWLCVGRQRFLKHALPGLRELAVGVQQERQAALEAQKRERARDAVRNGIGRNDPCPCGSGRKFKKCCGS